MNQDTFIDEVVKVIEKEFNIKYEGNSKDEKLDFLLHWIEERKLESFKDMIKRRNVRDRYNELAEHVVLDPEPETQTQLSFTLTEEQSNKAQNWIQQHESEGCTQEKSGSLGGTYSYVFTPSSLGLHEQVKCNLCSESLDLTDFSDW